MIWLGNLTPSALTDLRECTFEQAGEVASFLKLLSDYLIGARSDGGALDDDIYTNSRMLDGTGIWEKVPPAKVAFILKNIEPKVRKVFLDGIIPERRVYITNALQSFLNPAPRPTPVKAAPLKKKEIRSGRKWMRGKTIVRELDASFISAFNELINTDTSALVVQPAKGAPPFYGKKRPLADAVLTQSAHQDRTLRRQIRELTKDRT